MPRYKFKTIAEKGGMVAYLNSTKDQHRSFGYKTYRILRLAKLNITNRARAFDVTFETIRAWDAEDDRERAEATAKADNIVENFRDK